MADYTIMFHDLVHRAEVGGIHEATGADIPTILGRLFMLWRLFDRETEDGVMPSIGPRFLATHCGGDIKFWHAVASVGWLIIEPNGVTVPEFEKHHARSAKRRIRESARKRDYNTDELRRNCADSAPILRRESAEKASDLRLKSGSSAPPAPAPAPDIEINSSALPALNGEIAGIADGRRLFSEEDLRDTVARIFAKVGYGGTANCNSFWQAAAFLHAGIISEHELWDAVEGTRLNATRNVPGYFLTRIKQRLEVRGVGYRDCMRVAQFRGAWPTGPPHAPADDLALGIGRLEAAT